LINGSFPKQPEKQLKQINQAAHFTSTPPESGVYLLATPAGRLWDHCFNEAKTAATGRRWISLGQVNSTCRGDSYHRGVMRAKIESIVATVGSTGSCVGETPQSWY